MPLLSLRNISVRFANRLILDRVDLDIPASGLHAVMGPGASGKSTLLRVITGGMPRSSTWHLDGSIEYDGVLHDLDAWATRQHGDANDDDMRTPRTVLVEQQVSRITESLFDFLRAALPNRSTLSSVEQAEALKTWLDARGLSGFLAEGDRPLLDLSKRELRIAHLVAALLSRPDLLCVDEPFASLEDEEIHELKQLLRDSATQRAVVLVSHHQARVREVADTVSLLAHTRLVTGTTETEAFFEAPSSPIVSHYLRSGGVDSNDLVVMDEADTESESLPSSRSEAPTACGELAPQVDPPDACASDSAPGPIELETSSGTDEDEADALDLPAPRLALEPDDTATSHPWTAPGAAAPCPERPGSGPRNFVWLETGSLAGCPKPGLLQPLDYDARNLAAAGITVVITLTEESLHGEILASHGLHLVHFPMVDMEPPDDTEAALALCRDVETWLAEGHRAVYHCKAGIGRTGTMLVAHLIGRGLHFPEALELARTRRADWVQSQSQMDWLASLRPGFLESTS